MQTYAARILQTAVDIVHIMNPADSGQQLILEGLNPKAHPVHAAFLHYCQLLDIGRTRIGFH
ncbi:hypothetical protein D3C73_1252460 [compost metagenome]